MPYFNNNNKNILFIHIHKTGGTSIEKFFSNKCNIKLSKSSLYSNKYPTFSNQSPYKEMNINSSLQHITYTQMVENNKVFNINFDNIKIITIVRNPYERIISDLFYFNLIIIKTTKEKVFNIINNYLVSCSFDNHNIHQHYLYKYKYK